MGKSKSPKDQRGKKLTKKQLKKGMGDKPVIKKPKNKDKYDPVKRKLLKAANALKPWKKKKPQKPNKKDLKAKGETPKKGKKGSVLDQMRNRLQGGHFRWLNEKLYTTPGEEAHRLMQRDPSLYEQYHQGFREQTKGWPQQPVDIAIEWLAKKPSSWVVADLGCGDAKIAEVAQQQVKSFDLVATKPGVIECNMAELPVEDASVDAAVFCLSLMGTDYGSFLEEAARILKKKGYIWIAEVQSRFVDKSGNSVLDEFISVVESMGFELKTKADDNTHFLLLKFKKLTKGAGKPESAWPELRACQYKKR